MTRAASLPNEARAFLDALAIGESGGPDDDEHYSVLYGGAHFYIDIPTGKLMIIDKHTAWPRGEPRNTWPAGFPEWPGVWVDGSPTHAAGRYQFEPATWNDLQGRIKLRDFAPVSQDLAAWTYAIERIKMRGRNLLELLQTGDQQALEGVATALITSWTSLRSFSFPDRYRVALASYPAVAAIPAAVKPDCPNATPPTACYWDCMGRGAPCAWQTVRQC